MSLKREIFNIKECLAEVNTGLVKIKLLQHLLEGKLSDSHQQLVTKGRRSNQSSDDIPTGATLRCISYKALGFDVRYELGYPLPSEMTVRRRLRQFTVSPGFIDIPSLYLN